MGGKISQDILWFARYLLGGAQRCIISKMYWDVDELRVETCEGKVDSSYKRITTMRGIATVGIVLVPFSLDKSKLHFRSGKSITPCYYHGAARHNSFTTSRAARPSIISPAGAGLKGDPLPIVYADCKRDSVKRCGALTGAAGNETCRCHRASLWTEMSRDRAKEYHMINTMLRGFLVEHCMWSSKPPELSMSLQFSPACVRLAETLNSQCPNTIVNKSYKS